MWKSIQDGLDNAKQFVLAPLSNILCVAGVLLLLSGFIEYDDTHSLTLHGTPSWPRFIVGAALIVLGLAVFVVVQREMLLHQRLNYKKGVTIKKGELTILIKEQEIQNIFGATCNTAIILPCNTTFVDDCVADDRTALGAYCIKHFPEDVGSLPACFKSILDALEIKTHSDGQYSPGTTIRLPEKYERPAKIFLTASTIRTHANGVSSNPHIICNCVAEIFKQTAGEQLDTINMPILGSGHGSVDKGLALLFLLLAILHFSKDFSSCKNGKYSCSSKGC